MSASKMSMTKLTNMNDELSIKQHKQHDEVLFIWFYKQDHKNTILKLNTPVKQGPLNCPVYSRLPYIGKQAKFLKNKVKDTVYIKLAQRI